MSGSHVLLLDVLISSPSDVRGDVQTVEEAVLRWNSRQCDQFGVIFRARTWERDVGPAWDGSAQQAINAQLVERVHAAIALFWHRLGQPTDRYPSGTIEEISTLSARGVPPAILKCERALPTDLDTSQFDDLKSMIEALRQRGLVRTYVQKETLVDLVDSYLSQMARWYLEGVGSGHDPMGLVATPEQLVAFRNELRAHRRHVEHAASFFGLANANNHQQHEPFAGSELHQVLQAAERILCYLPEDAHARCADAIHDLAALQRAATRPLLAGGPTIGAFAVRWMPTAVKLLREIEDGLEEQWVVSTTAVPSLGTARRA